MVVTKLFIIGNTTVPSSWIAILTAFALAYGFIRIRYGKQLSGVLADSIYYFILVWKLSVILTDFKNVIKSPLSIIYFNGGQIGFYLGLIAAMIIIFIECKKKQLHRLDRMGLFAATVIIQAAYQVMMVFLNDGQIIVQMVTVIMFTLGAIFFWFLIKQENHSFPQLALLLVAIHLFVAAFQPTGLLGTPVIVTILLSLFFVVMLENSKEIEMGGLS